MCMDRTALGDKMELSGVLATKVSPVVTLFTPHSLAFGVYCM